MIVAICGIKRSASTVCYNIARIALQKAGYEVIIFGHEYKPDRPPKGNEAYLCKRHPFDRRLANDADYIILTDRDDRDIMDSLARFNNLRSGDGYLKLLRANLDKWMEYPHLMLPFKFWQHCENAYCGSIIDYLGLRVSAIETLEDFHNIQLPESGKDEVTLFFDNHITSA